ncbi:formate--tetrahydrofolate ligase [Corynebacterium cystitidis]|uniref:Formate--tetrahydrofolate ligase n=1 Tax=Corynebacterium cystitidis DSM 20524 TaxID=1121357 RepID=A0A1H9PP03_9CORY|nr:formate--tetrahydrofolate ligase [Corynebacterium cystitidis]WJY82430.1 Formate--tetrahydrofolate ligase [Corynebacterium cystitidis DSM 20524]SER49908.1 Formate-tetrahydrofolate ligase [Corynebacterium cystitidis DSM 20524]SNV75707.1 formate--tetrahydrofolate ligase [Corynebacterium cystitidis]
MLSDVSIAQAHELRPITEIAEKAGISGDALIPYGKHMAKIDLSQVRKADKPGKVVLVTGVSPTPAGEGKSTVLIGLTDALAQLGHKAMVALREPSLGPVFGIKGGAAGGGYSQVVPMENINLHFTGDFHAITAANNTLAALVDNHIHQGNKLRIDPRRIVWRRCLDVNDRSLREVVTGLGGPKQGTPTETGFTITAASEIMAILGLATDLQDLKRRLANVTVGLTYEGKPVTAGELGAQGALTALLKEAVNPNLVQTLGGTPAFIHGGPFANIAHGCNTLIATTTAQQYADIVCTEAGFGSDLGAEKFFDIKARYGQLDIAGAVIVTTIRSMKYNGGVAREALTDENVDALRRGICNLERHVDNVRKFGVKPVVAVNLFTSDTDAEREFMRSWAADFGVDLAEATVWADGGDGATELAKKVVANFSTGSKPLYDPADGIEASIETIAREIYHADKVEYSVNAAHDLQMLKDNGWDTLPVCISKTQYSFSDDPKQLGAPEGHTLHVRKLQPRTGAGFVVALTGDVMLMPGLGKQPAAYGIDVNESGEITGLT